MTQDRGYQKSIHLHPVLVAIMQHH